MRSGHRAKSPAVSRGSKACTGAHALNQATLSASGTRSTVDHGRTCAVSMAPTGSTCVRIQPSAAARSTLLLCRPAASHPASPGATSRVLGLQTAPGGTVACCEHPKSDRASIERKGLDAFEETDDDGEDSARAGS